MCFWGYEVLKFSAFVFIFAHLASTHTHTVTEILIELLYVRCRVFYSGWLIGFGFCYWRLGRMSCNNHLDMTQLGYFKFKLVDLGSVTGGWAEYLVTIT